MEETYLLFCKRLNSKRLALNLSQQALADRSNVSKSLISKIETAQVQPTIETASRIAEGLNSSLSEMFLTEQVGSVIFHPADQQFSIDSGEHLKRIMSPSMRRSCVEIFYENLEKSANTDWMTCSDADKYILALDDGLLVIAKDEAYTLKEGDCVHIEKNIEHCVRNESNARIKFITIIHRAHK
ncbi:MAG: helix-turn-helix domain-containing protein [Methylococcaceae bacterium]|nr:helix-turn-helix domain-containing protein [Methylococcaceae bacterium]